jgi:hypothetical protein
MRMEISEHEGALSTIIGCDTRVTCGAMVCVISGWRYVGVYRSGRKSG